MCVRYRIRLSYTRPGWSIASLALQVLSVGRACAVWTGIGAVRTVLMGGVLLGEALDAMRLGWVAVIVARIFGLEFHAE